MRPFGFATAPTALPLPGQVLAGRAVTVEPMASEAQGVQRLFSHAWLGAEGFGFQTLGGQRGIAATGTRDGFGVLESMPAA